MKEGNYLNLFERLLCEKANGAALSFDIITKEDFQQLYYKESKSDAEIADLFGVSVSKVKYKRNKYGLSLKGKIINDILSNSGEIAEEYNHKAFVNIQKTFDIDKCSKAVTHFIFRNGPVEDMHANGQFNQNDMKTLNKFMVNRLAYLLQLIKDNRWVELEFVIMQNSSYGFDWDNAEPDDGQTRELIEMYLKGRKK